MKEFVEFLRDDGIVIGKYRIRCFSFLWWAIRVLQGAASVGIFYLFYVLLWLVMGP